MRGPLQLVGQRQISAIDMVHPALQRVGIELVDASCELFSLLCWIRFDADDAIVPSTEVWAVASDCVNRVVSLLGLTIWAGLEVRLKHIRTEQPIDEKGTIRKIIMAEKAAEVRMPSAVPCDRVLSIRLDDRIVRAVTWIRRALTERDPFDRFLGLMFVSSLLAPLFEGAARRVRRCQLCGQDQEIGPGDAEYFMNFFVVTGGDLAAAREIWSLRGKLVHGGLEASADTGLAVLRLSFLLERALQVGFEMLLGKGSISIPCGPRFDLSSAHLDVRCIPSRS